MSNVINIKDLGDYFDVNCPNWESLRESYRPSKIKILIIGEAPPSNTRFFYCGDTLKYDNLFMEAIKVLYKEDANIYQKKRNSTLKKELLNKLKSEGFYLMDLYPFPIKKENGKKKKILKKIRDSYIDLFIEKFKKEVLSSTCKIVLLNSVKVLEIPLRKLGYDVFVVRVPSYGGNALFNQQFSEIVKL